MVVNHSVCVLEAENSVESAHFFRSIHRFDRDVETMNPSPKSVHRFDRDVEATEHFLRLAFYPLPLLRRLPIIVPGKEVRLRAGLLFIASGRNSNGFSITI